MQYLLFEDQSHFDLLPLTYTRPVWDLRVGITILREKWADALKSEPGGIAYDYLGAAFNAYDSAAEALCFNGKFVPNRDWVLMLKSSCRPGHFLHTKEGEILAFSATPINLDQFEGIVSQEKLLASGLQPQLLETEPPIAIRYPWDIFRHNGAVIRQDFERLTEGRTSAPIDDRHSIVYGKENIFLEEGVNIRAATLNAEDGPIYLGKNVQVQEGAIIHGAHAICDNAVLNMGAKLRGDTTVGPWSKVGGEIANSVIQGFSNKGHDGYLGNSVLGYWCNLGADTNTSNLKNNYAEVRLWNYPSGRFAKTGQTFCGLIMGDHSKCGINTMFNTGTVVGVSANIFGAGYPRNFIPSFSWGGASGFSTYRYKKAMDVAEVVMARRKKDLTTDEREILQRVYDDTATYRSWEAQTESKV